MKKQIGFVNLDDSTIQWLSSNLPQSELKIAIEKLASGEYSSIMLEPEGEIAAPASVIKCKGLVISERARTVERDGEEILLTPKEFDILLFLARNRGQVFTKEQIYRAVWEDDYIMDDSNIMAFIRKLRKKIEPDPDAPQYILTIWGIGYKFTDKI